MKLKRLFLCGLLAAALTLPLCLADESAEPTPAPTEAVVKTPAPTEAPAPEPEETSSPEGESTPEPSVQPDPTAEPSASAEPEASAEPSAAPDPTASAQPTVTPEPEVRPEPTPSASPSPAAVPEPGEPGTLLTIIPEGSAQQVNGVWNIHLTSADVPLAFAWTLPEDTAAQYYIVYSEDDKGILTLLQADLIEARIELPAMNYARGSFTLHVGAVLEDNSISWGRTDFTLDSGMSGRFPGGMGSFGGMPSRGASMLGGAEEGFRIIPGQALTDEHASGSMDKTAYTDAAIEISEEAVSCLTLGLSQAEITLDGGSFHVQLENGRLMLTPAETGNAWQLSVLAMNTLFDSGIERIVFGFGSMTVSLPTRMELCGSTYGALRSQGYVDKDILLTVTGEGVRASIASKDYRINDSGELVPSEG